MDIFGVAMIPAEDEPILPVDPDAPEIEEVALKLFQMVTGRDAQLFNLRCGMQLIKPHSGPLVHIMRQTARSFPLKQLLCFFATERHDHKYHIALISSSDTLLSDVDQIIRVGFSRCASGLT
jgi:hypothetical protein